MIEIQHDITLVTASILSALIACYLIIRIKKFASGAAQPNVKTFSLMLTAMLLGLLIWLIHFIGLTASFMLHTYEIDWGILLLSVLVVCFAAIFIFWLSTLFVLALLHSLLVRLLFLRWMSRSNFELYIVHPHVLQPIIPSKI